jgi:hypothetical protein
MKKIFIVLLFVLPLLATTQEEKKFGIQFSGFVKTDIFYDSRQTDDLREGHFLILPKNISKDELGNDINDQSSFNFLSIQTRLAGNITGPDVLKAKTSAYIEAEFFGTSNTDVNGFRLRHAYALLDWKKSELLVGQFWHPMFITSCFPTTVSFNTGAPFEPFSRNPQIRYTFRFIDFRIIGSLVAQRDFANMGPASSVPNANAPSSEYIRNAGIPEFNLKLEFNKLYPDKNQEFLVGAGIDYKSLKPMLTTVVYDTAYNPHVYTTDETVNGISSFLYFKLKFKPVTVKAQATLAQMSENLTMLGGYAVNDIIDSTKNTVSYTPMNVFSIWTDVHSNGIKWEFGLFAGYTKNNGYSTNIIQKPYGRGSEIDHVYRIAPRVVFKPGKMRFAVEVENTVAAYGVRENVNKGLVKDTTNVSNLRLLLAVYYMF